MKYNIEDFYKVLSENCLSDKFDNKVIIRSNDETIVLECINGQILGRIYKISETSLDKDAINEKLKEIWNDRTIQNINQTYPEIADVANRIRISRERNDILDELLKN
jgi:hypothetical protein